MVDFQVHDMITAPEASRPHLEAGRKRSGSVNNLNAVMAESPELVEGYNKLADLFLASSLPTEAKHVVWITASVQNNCEYCVAAHSTFALGGGLPASTVEVLRAGKPLSDDGLEAVRRLTQLIVAERGRVNDSELEAFLRAGYTRRHVLDIVLGVGMKTLSNYTNHITHTPLDAAWEAQKWSRDSAMSS